jgi:hypothetical protein
MLTGPGGDFQILQQAVANMDDWGLACKIMRYRELDDDIMAVAIKIEQYQHDLDAIRAWLSSCESCLMLAHASEWVAMLENISQKIGMVHSGWKRGSCTPHSIHVCTVPLEDEG